MQKIVDSEVIPVAGTYRIAAVRTPETGEMLSIYVNRVKKIWSDDLAATHIEDDLALKAGDIVESTGQIVITPPTSG